MIARYVRPTAQGNWSLTGEPGGHRVGLGEVAFVTPPDAVFANGFE